ncbi:MAG: metallopeptidase TldD-related protein [Cyanobacteria bacterium J06627_28]
MTLDTTGTVRSLDSQSTTEAIGHKSSTTQPLGEKTPSRYERAFHQLVDAIGEQVSAQAQTYFTATLAGESSQFTRFNSAKIRQTGQVQDGQLRLTLMTCDRTTSTNIPFVGDFTADWAITQPALAVLRQELPQLPTDPYVVIPSQTDQVSTREIHSGKILPAEAIAQTLLTPVQASDFSGLYASGLSYRGYADSTGKHHWFETPSFTLDYSLFGQQPNQAVKGTFAGQHWDSVQYNRNIAATEQKLVSMNRPIKSIPRGAYRTYLAPAAVGDIIDTMMWGGLGESALQQSNSAFNKLAEGKAQLSEKFSLQENFQRIKRPRFNRNGDIAPAELPIIHKGRWANALVSRRSAKEYGKPSNAASAEEAMRAPTVSPGTLKQADILAELGTGLYLSNLHYLNWSDLTAGRITGMTRYACFWVENGEIVAPIENLRFDDDLYRFLGEGLIDLTEQQTFLPAVGTYDRRSLGGMWMPGMLIDQFRYTL